MKNAEGFKFMKQTTPYDKKSRQPQAYGSQTQKTWGNSGHYDSQDHTGGGYRK